MKVVINVCFGGFGLSNQAVDLLCERGVDKDQLYNLLYEHKGRTDPKLIKVIEELGTEANGVHAELKVVEIPNNVKWHIHEYDGMEHIAEDHETWS